VLSGDATLRPTLLSALGVRPIFAKQKSREGAQALYLGCNVKTAMEALAKQIERQMHGKLWAQCAMYERVSERIWPLNEKDREAKIAQFAKKYGFRLRFYIQGMCAIFDKWPRPNCK